MRLLVLGTSSSAGVGHPDPEAVAWPWLLGRRLAVSIGEPVEVEHVRLVPMGSRPVPMALAAVERFEPDVVVFSFGAVLCSLATVSDRVRQLFGERAHRYFRRAERKVDSVVGSSALRPRRGMRHARWLARHTIGTATLATYEEVARVLEEIVHLLSQREGLVVVVACEPDLPEIMLRDNPKSNLILQRMRAQIEGAGRSHRFLIANFQPAFGTPTGEQFYLSDVLHKSVLGHEAQASVLVESLTRAPSPLARG